MATPDDDPFEKTFRLVCRLDDAEIDYVRNTGEWIARCVHRVSQLDASADHSYITAQVLDMSTHGRWRLMKPETVGEQLATTSAR